MARPRRRRFLRTAYIQAEISEITRHAAAPDNTIKIVAQKLRFTDDQRRDILAHFIRGADLTVGGIVHAVTSTAQTQTDADTAHGMEADALQAMHLAARA